MQRKERTEQLPTYEEIISRGRAHQTNNYLFRGAKLDIAKEMFGHSVLSLSNTDRGLNMNYSTNSLKRALSLTLYENGSILAKVSSPGEGSGVSAMYMCTPGEREYIEIGARKSLRRATVAFRALGPYFSINGKQGLVPVVKDIFQETKDIAKKGSVRDIRSIAAESGRKIFKSLEEGIFTVSAVVQATPSFHLAMEHILSVQRKDMNGSWPKYNRSFISACLAKKSFSTWSVMGMLQSTGRAEAVLEKEVEEGITMCGEVSLETGAVIRKKVSIWEAVAGKISLSIAGYRANTRVGVSTDGVLSAVSDIFIGDGASLNASAQISSTGEPVLGLGFTMTA